MLKINKIFTLAPLALAVATGVQAQQEEQNEKRKGHEIEVINVTAQKRVESVQEIPVSLTALSGDMIEDLKMNTSSDLASAIPNLQSSLVYGETQPIFSIRGMSMSDYNSNQASPVSVYIDEVAVSSNFMQGLSMYDLERVEVLRGPQGTLYGKNTTGGAINFITKTPDLLDTSGNIKLQLGNYGRKHISGAVETPLIEDKLGARLAFTHTDIDGYHKNHFSGADDLTSTDSQSIRLTLKYVEDDFEALLKVASGKNDGQTAGVVSRPAYDIGSYKFDALGATLIGVYGLTPKMAVDMGLQPRDANWDAWEGSHNKANKYETEFDSATLRLNWDLGQYNLTSVTGFMNGKGLNSANTDGAAYRLLEIDWGSEVDQFSQDIRLTSNFDGDFNFILGLYFDQDEIKAHNKFDFFLETEALGVPNPTLASQTLAIPANAAIAGSAGFTTDQKYSQERNSTAIYFDGNYALNEQITLRFGLRYTQDEGEGRDINTYLGDYNGNKIQDLITNNPTINPELLSTQYNPEDLKWDQNKVTGKLGIDYQQSKNILYYASVSRGYRASAFNGGAQFFSNELSVAKPETVDAIELGFKSDLLDNTLRLNGALFSYDYTDQQFINVIGVQQFLVNGDKSSIRGAELELTWVPTSRIQVNAGLGLLDTEFKKLELNDSTGNPVVLSGNELFNAPKVNFNVAIQYILLEAEHGLLELGVNSNYISRQWFSAFNELNGYEHIKADSGWVTNASLTWTSDDDWSASLWVKNIGENDEKTYAINLQGSFGFDYNTVGSPLTFGADFTYEF
jgi:iron complex outermembrane receptor protein|tara:strand:- start:822 stop:3203 length:2382 start_codon:yes stop_codon:yes gene_type:complete